VSDGDNILLFLEKRKKKFGKQSGISIGFT